MPNMPLSPFSLSLSFSFGSGIISWNTGGSSRERAQWGHRRACAASSLSSSASSPFSSSAPKGCFLSWARRRIRLRPLGAAFMWLSSSPSTSSVAFASAAVRLSPATAMLRSCTYSGASGASPPYIPRTVEMKCVVCAPVAASAATPTTLAVRATGLLFPVAVEEEASAHAGGEGVWLIGSIVSALLVGAPCSDALLNEAVVAGAIDDDAPPSEWLALTAVSVTLRPSLCGAALGEMPLTANGCVSCVGTASDRAACDCAALTAAAASASARLM